MSEGIQAKESLIRMKTTVVFLLVNIGVSNQALAWSLSPTSSVPAGAPHARPKRTDSDHHRFIASSPSRPLLAFISKQRQHGMIYNTAGALSYQVGDSYNDMSEAETDTTDDMHSNTFGDVLEAHREYYYANEDEEYGVHQLDVVEKQKNLDERSNAWLEYAFTSDFNNEEEDDDDDGDDDADAAQTIFPFLDHWHVLTETDDDGCSLLDRSSEIRIAGIVSNDPRNPSGHAIVTSNLDLDLLDIPRTGKTNERQSTQLCSPEAIVTTVTGSQYLLGSNQLVLQLDDWAVMDLNQIEGSISTIATVDSHSESEDAVARLGEILVQRQSKLKCAIAEPDLSSPETTLEESMMIVTTTGCLYRLGAPFTYPLLNQWKRLDGGSIAGIVSRHKDIPDGELITTSPLVELDESREGLILVTTESGSQYELGEAEPTKEELWRQEQVDQHYEMEAEADIQENEEEAQNEPTLSPSLQNPRNYSYACSPS